MKISIPAIYEDLDWKEKKAIREEYVRIQSGNCYHCGCPLSETPPQHILSKKITPRLYPPNFFKYPVHLHHSHETGLTIGAVHNYCNAILWEYHDE